MKVVVGLSGGVDSSVAAKLLVDQGHEVIGVFMRNWEDGGENCTATQDLADAESVAKKLGIEFHSVNFAKEYWEHVFEYFLSENRAGRTPNPDILCNKYVKFGPFLDYAKSLGAEKIATGHYAKIQKSQEFFELCVPKDTNKDQTYFLHQLNQDQLSMTLFPLQDLQKKEVRRIAEENGFINAEKKDSTGICFVGPKNYRTFLEKYIAKNPGKMLDFETKKEVGSHIGLSFYTIGQSEGLKIGGQKGFPDGKWYVIEKDSEKNVLYVSQSQEFLLSDALECADMHWVSGKIPGKSFRCRAKIRYRDEGEMCEVRFEDGKMKAVFDEPVRAITAGQSVVLYDGDVCLGGGIID